MYKLVIIEDEAVVRRNIIKKIEWEKYGFIIVGEAENGKEALEVIENTNPDVIITDIEMPFMDGLKLSNLVRKKYPSMKIVLLTGFDEFKYAQQAIELNVIEYVLKPVSSESLTKVLVKIKERIDEEVFQKENLELLKEHYLKSIPVMKVNFLSTLIAGKQNREEILSKANYFEIDFSGDIHLACIISIDNNTIDKNNFKEEDYELIKFAVLNTTEDILSKNSIGITFSYDNYNVLIISTSNYRKEHVLDKILNILEEIRMTIEKYMKFTVTIGIGNICTEIENISTSYNNALSALDYRFTLGNNRIIYIEDLEPQSFEKLIFDDKKEHMLISSIKFGNEGEVCATIETLFHSLADTKTSFNDYQIYLLEILAAIIKTSKSLRLDTNIVFGESYNLFDEMFKFDTISEVKEWFKSICINLMNSISKRRQNSCIELVERAKEYIKRTYNENDISLNKVSGYLHISPNYFGSIFKNETGETFINFLLKVRMESAKDLICATKMKNFEIAEKVGYADEHYFSYCFKKFFKISPNEFRKGLNKK